MDGFVSEGPLFLKPPIKHLLRGIYFESSSYDANAFYVTAFVMLLCVPATNVDFTFGHRIRRKEGGDRWKLQTPDLIEELDKELSRSGAEFLSGIDSASAFVAYAQSLPRTERVLEGIGYALARDEQLAQANETFRELADRLEPDGVHWHRKLLEQVRSVQKVLTEYPEQVSAYLDRLEQQTTESLGLTRFRG